MIAADCAGVAALLVQSPVLYAFQPDAQQGAMSGNLFRALPASGEEEEFVELLSRPGLKIERIVSWAQASPPGFWYDQPDSEVVKKSPIRDKAPEQPLQKQYDTNAFGLIFRFFHKLSEWVLLLAGEAGLRFDDEEAVRVLAPGDFVEIAPHRRHRVEWTHASEPTIWLAVHYK